jgi:ATP phosphoribosyltransferase regulatory subunit
VAADSRERILAELAAGDFVGVEHELSGLGLAADAAQLLLRVPRVRGGPEVLENLTGLVEEAAAGMRAVHALVPAGVAERIIFDFGLVRSLGYYTGAVFQVYDPAHGVPIGSGGRYDELLARFGRPLPAVGFALNVERLHIALAGEERGRMAAPER